MSVKTFRLLPPLGGMALVWPHPSWRAQRSNPAPDQDALDCFAPLATTNIRFTLTSSDSGTTRHSTCPKREDRWPMGSASGRICRLHIGGCPWSGASIRHRSRREHPVRMAACGSISAINFIDYGGEIPLFHSGFCRQHFIGLACSGPLRSRSRCTEYGFSRRQKIVLAWLTGIMFSPLSYFVYFWGQS